MMQLVLLEPTRPDHSRDCARFERIVSSLRGQGWDVRINGTRSERRSAVAEVVVRLVEPAPDTALDSLELILAEHLGESLPRRHHQRGRVVIYDEGGQVLRIREVADADAAQPGTRPSS
jgi:hypothetical protein